MSSKNSQELKQKQTQNSNMSGTGNWQRVQRRPQQQGQRNTFHRNRNGVEEQDGNRRPYQPYNRNNNGERRPYRPRNNGGQRQGGNGRPHRQYNRNGNRRPYRPRNQQHRRPQPKREVMAPNSIAAWGLSKDKSFKVKVQRASRSGEMVSRETSNQFSALNRDEKRREEIEGPKFGARNSDIGAWGTKLAVEASDEPVKFKSLKEIEDEKEEQEYEEQLEKETNQMTQLDPRSLFTPAVIGNWGDMAMEEDEQDDEDYTSTEYHAAAEIQQLDGWYD